MYSPKEIVHRRGRKIAEWRQNSKAKKKTLVHVDIWLTTYLPYVDNRGHLTDHLPTSSCPRSLWTTPIIKLTDLYIFMFLTKSSSQSYLIILRRVKIEYFTLLFIFFKKFISFGTTNFKKHECQCPQFKVLQSVFCLFYMNSYIGIFLVYFDLNWELLPCKNTQKVNKQKIRCKNLGFVLVIRMSWTR